MVACSCTRAPPTAAGGRGRLAGPGAVCTRVETRRGTYHPSCSWGAVAGRVNDSPECSHPSGRRLLAPRSPPLESGHCNCNARSWGHGDHVRNDSTLDTSTVHACPVFPSTGRGLSAAPALGAKTLWRVLQGDAMINEEKVAVGRGLWCTNRVRNDSTSGTSAACPVFYSMVCG